MNEAELVLSDVLNCDRLSLYLNKDMVLNRDQSVLIAQIFKRRINGEPLQYILGRCEFMGREFKIDQRALIPRPETEILVESALKELSETKNACPSVFDLGTGSGCIAVSVAKLFPQALVWAADISAQALELARQNASLNNVKIEFLHGDLFSALNNINKKFDLIISNPPYIALNQLADLSREISFEPYLALAAGSAGLDFYRDIINQAAGYLNNCGLLAFEVGLNQAEAVNTMLKQQNFSDIRIIKDYNNLDRVVIGKKKG